MAWTNEERYADGAKFAEEVQTALASGKTWDDILSEMHAVPPEEAAKRRTLYRESIEYSWWDGYVSRWD